MSKPNPRDAIRAAINPSDWNSERLQALYACTTEDFLAAGCDPVTVYAAMIRSWTIMRCAEHGDAKAIAELRSIADSLERRSFQQIKH